MRLEKASRVRSLGSTAATPAKNASSARPRRTRSLVAKLPTSSVAVDPCPRALLIDFPALRSHRFEPPASYRTTILRRPPYGQSERHIVGDSNRRGHGEDARCALRIPWRDRRAWPSQGESART